MPRCIYGCVEFDKSDGEHILQNFLGARWTSDQIVANDTQSEFGRTIDVALEKGLQPIRNLFGTRGGRGDHGPTLMNLPASSGELLDLEPGARPRLRQPVIREQTTGGGHARINFQLGTMHQLPWALSQVRNKYPNMQVNEAQLAASATPIAGFVDGAVKLELDLGGSDYFRGMLKACFNLLGVRYADVVFGSCFDAARWFIKDGIGNSEQFVRWIPSSDRMAVPQLGPSDQAIFLLSRGKSVEGVVQYFGELVHSFRLADSYEGPALKCGYVVDPFRESQPAEERAPSFKEDSIPIFADQAQTYDESVMASFEKRLGRIFKLYYERSQQQMIERTIEEVVREHPGDTFTEEMAAELSERLARRALRLPTSLPPKPSGAKE